MNKSIRRNVFETNSSSTHSLSMTKNFIENPSNYEATIIVKGIYFDCYADSGACTIEEKIEYVYALAKNMGLHDEDFKTFIKAIFPRVKLEIEDEAYCKAGIDYDNISLLENYALSWTLFLTKPYIINIAER